MSLELSRRYVDGAWRYVAQEEAAGGGAAPARNVGQCRLEFAAVSSGPVAFTFGQGDETFIDITTPTTPKPVAAGIYSYTLIVIQDGGVGGLFIVSLTVDEDYYTIVAPAVSLGGQNGLVTLSTTWYSDALSSFRAAIDDLSDGTYTGYLYVQKIS